MVTDPKQSFDNQDANGDGFLTKREYKYSFMLGAKKVIEQRATIYICCSLTSSNFI